MLLVYANNFSFDANLLYPVIFEIQWVEISEVAIHLYYHFCAVHFLNDRNGENQVINEKRQSFFLTSELDQKVFLFICQTDFVGYGIAVDLVYI